MTSSFMGLAIEQEEDRVAKVVIQREQARNTKHAAMLKKKRQSQANYPKLDSFHQEK